MSGGGCFSRRLGGAGLTSTRRDTIGAMAAAAGEVGSANGQRREGRRAKPLEEDVLDPRFTSLTNDEMCAWRRLRSRHCNEVMAES